MIAANNGLWEDTAGDPETSGALTEVGGKSLKA